MSEKPFLDPEIAAMAAIAAALDPLAEDARVRVIAWARARYSTGPAPPSMAATTFVQPSTVSPNESSTTLAEFIASCEPEDDAHRVLATATFLTKFAGADSFTSAQVNTKLKHLGHPIDNIARVLDGLMAQRPQLVVQLRKSGQHRQSRRLFKVTEAGAQEVQKMLQRADR
jgi:hypothetical protein